MFTNWEEKGNDKKHYKEKSQELKGRGILQVGSGHFAKSRVYSAYPLYEPLRKVLYPTGSA